MFAKGESAYYIAAKFDGMDTSEQAYRRAMSVIDGSNTATAGIFRVIWGDHVVVVVVGDEPSRTAQRQLFRVLRRGKSLVLHQIREGRHLLSDLSKRHAEILFGNLPKQIEQVRGGHFRIKPLP